MMFELGRPAGILPGGRVHPDVTARIDSARGGGSPLESPVREELSATLGDDFSGVRVHADPLAAALARSVRARAFTTGSDIFFGDGEFQPGSAGGRQLLAHELTHVVQQRGLPTQGALTVTDPGDAQEAEAERIARGL